MSTEPKQTFTSAEPGAPTDTRIATALEFIAHCFDRIDGHLESLAKRAETDPIGETIRHEMIELRDHLDRKMPNL